MADEDIVVEIEKDDAATTAEVKQSDPVDDLKAQFKELEAEKTREQESRQAAQRQAETERQARVAAEQERDAGRTEITETRLGTVEQGIASAVTASEAAKAEIKTAMEAGDWEKLSSAQEKLADARSHFNRLTEAKADLEVQKATPQRTEPERPAATADPIEAYISGRTAQTQGWLRAHKDFITDPRKNAKLTGAHWDAVGEGLTPDTTEYFSHVEKFLGLTKDAPANGKGNGTSAPARRAASAPVAPVQASAGGTSGGGPEVRLTKGEATAATDGTLKWNMDDPSPQKRYKKGDPIGIQEMARRKHIMQGQGLYDKTYTEQ